MTLTPFDWAIIVVYLAGCMTAGIWMRRYVRDVEDFAVAGREMDVNLGIASLAATELGVVTLMYAAQLGYEKGFAGAMIGVLTAAAMFLVGRTGFVIQPLRASGVMTIPELFQKRFGTKVRWLAGFFVVLGGVLNMGIFLRLGGDFLVHATGMSPKYLEWVMTALLALVLIYTVFGGMLSVLVTDYLQFLVMGLGIVIVSVLVISDIGWSSLVDQLWTRYNTAPALAGKVAAHPFNPFHSSSLGWTYILWMFVFQIAVACTWQTQISRVLASKDEHVAKKIYSRTAFYFVGRFALPVLWGAGAMVYFNNRGGLPDGVDSLTAMPTYLSTILPVGIIGLVIAGMLAAEMSTDSGYLLTWATVVYNDLIMPCFKKPLSGKTQLLITRGIVLAIGVFLVFYGLWHQMPGNAWDYLAVTGSIYISSIFTLLVAGLYWPRANSVGAFAALILGALGPLTFLFINYLVTTGRLSKAFQIAPQLAGAAAFGLSFLGMFVGSMLKPNKPDNSARQKIFTEEIV